MLKKHFHDQKPTETISVEVKMAVPKGQNYASMIYRVKISCFTASGKKRRFSIIVKTALKSEGIKEAPSYQPAFQNETRIYTMVLPLMEGLMEEHNDRREKLWPDILGFRPYNLIAFEDLSEQEYVVANRRKGLDLNHSKLVLRHLARFHAMSKVLMEKSIITFEGIGKLLLTGDGPFLRVWWDILVTVIADAMENNWGDDWKEIAGKMRKQLGVVGSKLRSATEEFDQRFGVLNHGDLWTCNMMFKYMEHEENVPVSVRFLDYQGSHINSFIWDITQFLFSSTIPSVRKTRLDELLTTYHQAFEKNLKTFNYKGYVPTLEDVRSEWKRVEYGHLCFLMIQPIASAETATAMDLAKIFTHPPHEVVDDSVFTDGKALLNTGEDYTMLARNGII